MPCTLGLTFRLLPLEANSDLQLTNHGDGFLDIVFRLPGKFMQHMLILCSCGRSTAADLTTGARSETRKGQETSDTEVQWITNLSEWPIGLQLSKFHVPCRRRCSASYTMSGGRVSFEFRGPIVRSGNAQGPIPSG
jgi:hypothetical protein